MGGDVLSKKNLRRSAEWGVRIAALSLPGLFLVGCAGESSPPVSTPQTKSSSSEAKDRSAQWKQWRPAGTEARLPQVSSKEAATLRDRWLSARAAELGVDKGSVPPLVRLVSPDETAEVTAACMREKGFDAKISPDGMVEVNRPDSQAAAEELASFECDAMFTVDARFLVPGTSGLAEILWEYNRDFLIPCIEEQGYEILESLPSKEAFVSGTPWQGNPAEILAKDERSALLAACPNQPPAAAFTG